MFPSIKSSRARERAIRGAGGGPGPDVRYQDREALPGPDQLPTGLGVRQYPEHGTVDRRVHPQVLLALQLRLDRVELLTHRRALAPGRLDRRLLGLDDRLRALVGRRTLGPGPFDGLPRELEPGLDQGHLGLGQVAPPLRLLDLVLRDHLPHLTTEQSVQSLVSELLALEVEPRALQLLEHDEHLGLVLLDAQPGLGDEHLPLALDELQAALVVAHPALGQGQALERERLLLAQALQDHRVVVHELDQHLPGRDPVPLDGVPLLHAPLDRRDDELRALHRVERDRPAGPVDRLGPRGEPQCGDQQREERQ